MQIPAAYIHYYNYNCSDLQHIGSGIFSYIYHKNQPSVGKYNIPYVDMVWVGFSGVNISHLQPRIYVPRRQCFNHGIKNLFQPRKNTSGQY